MFLERGSIFSITILKINTYGWYAVNYKNSFNMLPAKKHFIVDCIVFIQKKVLYMDSLSESMTKHLCPTCCGICDKGIVIIKTQDTTELYCPDYKPNREIIKKLAYQDNEDI